ncbi:Cilia- and flagella-associated protein 46 [Rhizophlyctis rosea]|nr:Cilia- and flagella-associated protein 46 [Rhizophlyctis rosea]
MISTQDVKGKTGAGELLVSTQQAIEQGRWDEADKYALIFSEQRDKFYFADSYSESSITSFGKIQPQEVHCTQVPKEVTVATKTLSTLISAASVTNEDLYNASVALVDISRPYLGTDGGPFLEALESFVKALEDRNDEDIEWRAFLHRAIGKILLQQNRNADAIKHLRQTVSLSESRPELRSSLLPLYQLLLSIDPKTPPTKSDQTYRMISLLKQAKSIGPGNDTKFNQLIAELEGLLFPREDRKKSAGSKLLDVGDIAVELAKEALNRGMADVAERVLQQVDEKGLDSSVANRRRLVSIGLKLQRTSSDLISRQKVVTDAMTGLQSIIQSALMLDDAQITVEACITLWDLVTKMEKGRTVVSCLKMMADALETVRAGPPTLRSRIHYELADHFGSTNLLTVALQHMQRAIALYPAADDLMEEMRAKLYKLEVTTKSPFDPALRNEWKALSLVASMPAADGSPHILVEAMRLLVPNYELDDQVAFDMESAITRSYTFPWTDEGAASSQIRRETFISLLEVMKASHSRMQADSLPTKPKQAATDVKRQVYGKIAYQSANYLLGQAWDVDLVVSYFNAQLCESAAVAVESLRMLTAEESEKLYQYIAATLVKAFDIALPLPTDWNLRQTVTLVCNFYMRCSPEMRRLSLWIETFEHIHGKLSGSALKDSTIFVTLCTSYAQALLDMEMDSREAQPTDRQAEDKAKGKPGKAGGKAPVRDAPSATLKLAEEICKAGMENKSTDPSIKFSLLQVWKRLCDFKGVGPPALSDGTIRTCASILSLDSSKDANQQIAPLMKELKGFDLAGDILLQLWLHLIRYLADTKQWELALDGLGSVQTALRGWRQYFPSDMDFKEWVATFELTCGQVLESMSSQRTFDTPTGMCMQAIEHFINGINIACSSKPPSTDLVSSAVKSFWNVVAAHISEKRRFVDPIQNILKSISKSNIQIDPLACDYLFRLLKLGLHQCSTQKDFTTGLRLLEFAAKALPKSFHHEIAAMKIIFLGGKDLVAVNIIIKDAEEESQLWRSLARTLNDQHKKREAYEQALQILDKAGNLTLKKVELMIEYAQSQSRQGNMKHALGMLEEAEGICMSAAENAQTQLVLMKVLTLRAILVESRQERVSGLDNAFTQVENVVRQLFERAQQLEVQYRSQGGGKAKGKGGQAETEILQMPDIDQWDAFAWPEALSKTMHEADDGITLTARSVDNSDIMCWLQILASQLIKYEKLAMKSLPVVALMDLMSRTCLEDSPETREVQSGVSMYWATSLNHLGFIDNAQKNYKASLPTLEAKWDMNRLTGLFPLRIPRIWVSKMECYLAWGDLDVARQYATNFSALPELLSDDIFEATVLDALALTASGEFSQSDQILQTMKDAVNPQTFMRVSYALLLNKVGIVRLSERTTSGVDDCLACVRSVCRKADSLMQTDPWMMEYSDHLLRIETDLLLRLLKTVPGTEEVVAGVLDKRVGYFKTLKDAEMMGEIFIGKARAVPLDGKGQKAERRRLLRSREIVMEGKQLLEDARRLDSEIYMRVLLQLASTELEIALYKDLPPNSGQVLDVMELLDAMENKEKDEMEWRRWKELKVKACDNAVQLLQRHEDNVVEGKGTLHYVLGMAFLEKGGGLKSAGQSRQASGNMLNRRQSMHASAMDNRIFAEEHLTTALEIACEEMNFERMAVIAEAFLTRNHDLEPAAAFNHLALLQGTSGATYLQKLWEEVNGYMVTLKTLSRTPYIDFPGMPFWKDCVRNTLQKSTVHHIKNDASYGRCQLPPDFAFADWPATLRVLILQHSSDRSTLFGGLLWHKGDVAKGKKGDDTVTDAMVTKLKVDSHELEHIRQKIHSHDDDAMRMLEAYLKPIVAALNLDQATSDRPTTSAAPTKKKGKKEKDKGEAPAEDKTHYVLLTDEYLEDLPLEAVLPAVSTIKSMSRDFDLHILQERLLSLSSDTAVAEPPKKKKEEKVAEADGSGPQVDSLSYFIDGTLGFTKGVQSILGQLPSNDVEGTFSNLEPSEWLDMIKRKSSHVFIGGMFPKRLLDTIVKVDLQGFQVCTILDTVITTKKRPAHSFGRIKKLAATFSLSGVNAVVVPYAFLGEEETTNMLRRVVEANPSLGRTMVDGKTPQGANAFCMFGLPPTFRWKS